METEMYNQLIIIFEKYRDSLQNEERELFDKVLRAYNSQLFIILNKLKEIPNYKELSYKEIAKYLMSDIEVLKTIKKFKNACDKYNNGELKGEEYSFLSLIKFTKKFEDFIDSIINICDILESHIGNLITETDIELYRGFNAKEGEERIARSEYISTSTSINIAKEFTNRYLFYETSSGIIK